MTSSIFSSLLSTVDTRRVDEIASHLGESPEAVSHGLEATTASLIGGLANKAGDSNWMNQIFKLVSQAPAEVNVSDLANSITDPRRGSAVSSSLLNSGKSFLSMIFGSNQSSILDAIGRSTGLRSSIISSLMSMAAPLLMSALGRFVRENRTNPSGLKDLLIHEGESVSGFLPPGFSNLLAGGAPSPAYTAAANTRPVAIGTIVEPESRNWLWLIPALLLIGPLLYWGWTRIRPAVEAPPALATPTAVTNLGRFIQVILPGGVTLNIPQYGVESQLLTFIQDPSKSPDQNVWFNYDRLLFNTDSTTLRPESGEQLRNIAAIMTAYPKVHLKIGGYTDNVGDADSNLRLSQDRANAVMAELVRLGVAPERMEAQGYGEQYPVADNTTADGRAKNRRISVNVTEK